MSTCGARPTKRNSRRTKEEIQTLRFELLEIIEQYEPMTVRQVYYQAVSRGLIAKTEAAYKNVVVRLLTRMRRDGELPYVWIADSTRWMRKPDSYDSLEDALKATQRTYRRAVWQNQECRVEVWSEKEAIAGILFDVTAKWDVPLMVCRGYPSLSYLHSAAEVIKHEAWLGRSTRIYYFGDHDPSGKDIARFVEEELARLIAPHGLPGGCRMSDIFTFSLAAVTSQQIAEMSLPTRPTKRSDSRSRGFAGESVEVDAIEPTKLRELCEQYITANIDEDAYLALKEVEHAERETLSALIEGGMTK